MPDHINIVHPGVHRRHREDMLGREKLIAERDNLARRVMALENDLDAIFTRIARSDEVELHYPSGEVIIVRREDSRMQKRPTSDILDARFAAPPDPDGIDNSPIENGAAPCFIGGCQYPKLTGERDRVIEECAQHIRHECAACEGTGHADPSTECEYCGRPMESIKRLKSAGLTKGEE